MASTPKINCSHMAEQQMETFGVSAKKQKVIKRCVSKYTKDVSHKLCDALFPESESGHTLDDDQVLTDLTNVTTDISKSPNHFS